MKGSRQSHQVPKNPPSKGSKWKAGHVKVDAPKGARSNGGKGKK
jgi:hypothetical protein